MAHEEEQSYPFEDEEHDDATAVDAASPSLDQLVNACKDGDVWILRKYLDAGCDVNLILEPETNDTLLHIVTLHVRRAPCLLPSCLLACLLLPCLLAWSPGWLVRRRLRLVLIHY